LNSYLIIKNGIQIGEKCIENFMNMVLKKKLINKHKYQKRPFHASLLGDELNKFQFGNLQWTKTYGTYIN
jgi:hypothetical protein